MNFYNISRNANDPDRLVVYGRNVGAGRFEETTYHGQLPAQAWVFGDGRQLYVGRHAFAYRGPEVPLMLTNINVAFIPGGNPMEGGFMVEINLPLEVEEVVTATAQGAQDAEVFTFGAGEFVVNHPLPILLEAPNVAQTPTASLELYGVQMEYGLHALIAEPGLGKSALGRTAFEDGLAERFLIGEGREPPGYVSAPVAEPSMRGLTAALTLGTQVQTGPKPRRVKLFDSARPLVNVALGAATKGGFDKRLADQLTSVDAVARDRQEVWILKMNLETDDPEVVAQSLKRLYGVATGTYYVTRAELMGPGPTHPAFRYSWVKLSGGRTRGISTAEGFRRGAVTGDAYVAESIVKDVAIRAAAFNPRTVASKVERELSRRTRTDESDPQASRRNSNR